VHCWKGPNGFIKSSAGARPDEWVSVFSPWSFLINVINQLDIPRPLRCQHEAQTELIVDADAVLPGAIPFQSFQSVARRYAQKTQLRRGIQLVSLRRATASMLAKRATRTRLNSRSYRHMQRTESSLYCISIHDMIQALAFG